MDRTEEWRFFVEQLQESALKDIHSSREYELRKTRQEGLRLAAEKLGCIGVNTPRRLSERSRGR